MKYLTISKLIDKLEHEDIVELVGEAIEVEWKEVMVNGKPDYIWVKWLFDLDEDIDVDYVTENYTDIGNDVYVLFKGKKPKYLLQIGNSIVIAKLYRVKKPNLLKFIIDELNKISINDNFFGKLINQVQCDIRDLIKSAKLNMVLKFYKLFNLM